MCPTNFLALFDLAAGWRFDEIFVSDLCFLFLCFSLFILVERTQEVILILSKQQCNIPASLPQETLCKDFFLTKFNHLC